MALRQRNGEKTDQPHATSHRDVDEHDEPLGSGRSGRWAARARLALLLARGTAGTLLEEALIISRWFCQLGFDIALEVVRFDFSIGHRVIAGVVATRKLLGGTCAEFLAGMSVVALLGAFSGLLAVAGLNLAAALGGLAAIVASLATPAWWAAGFALLFVAAAAVLCLLVPTQPACKGLSMIGEVVWLADVVTDASLTMARTVTQVSLRGSIAALRAVRGVDPAVALQVVKASMAQDLFSRAMSERLDAIREMFVRFGTEVAIRVNLQGLSSCFRMLVRLQELGEAEAPVGREVQFSDSAAGALVKRYVGYAMGTHGHAGLKFLGLVQYGSVSTNEEAFAHCAGIPVSDILSCEWKGLLHMPGYVLAVDRPRRSIVVAFRGTLWPQDWVTDLDCAPRACLLAGHGGLAHSGMLSAAEQAVRRLEPVVAGLLASKEYHGYSVTVTGHSLGAGVAALVTAMWLGPDSPLGDAADRLRCIGFGMPAVASSSFSAVALLRSRITAVVCGSDIVPRFSLASVTRLRDAVLDLWEARDGMDKEALDNPIAAHEYLLRLRSEEGKAANEMSLCPLGQVLWVPPSGSRVVEVADPGKAFEDIRLLGSIFQPHLPQNYSERIALL